MTEIPQESTMPSTPRPVVFIHGLWLHAASWQPWFERFAQEGYRPLAPGWPGVAESVAQARATPDDIAGHGIDDVVDHYAGIIAGLDAPPVLVGHSFGGMIAEKLLGQDRAACAVAIDAAQIKGVLALPLSALRATLPVLRNPANSHRAISLTADQFRYGFGNAIPHEESDALYERWTIPAPGKPLFEAATAAFHADSPSAVNTANADRGPLLLIGGGKDHTVPTAVTRSTLKQYEGSGAVTDLVEFPDRGHSLTIDHGWPELAEATLAWLDKNGLGPR
jgi:pimeloyl-ACP methyl ester carboxylesterase